MNATFLFEIKQIFANLPREKSEFFLQYLNSTKTFLFKKKCKNSSNILIGTHFVIIII